MGRRKRKRLFPQKYGAGYISAPRIDANKAAAYNSQRSKATLGSRADTQHDPDSNFLADIPPTPRLSSPIPWYEDDALLNEEEKKQIKLHREIKKHEPFWRRSERGKVIDSRQELYAIEEQGLFKLYQVWAGGRRQGIGQYFTRTIKKNLTLFFSGNEYLFVMEFKDERWVSKVYQDVSTAAERARSMKIAWPHKQKISKSPK